MATEQVWPGDGSVEFVTAFREKDYVEWVPMDAGGGLAGRHDWNSPMVADLREKQGRFGKLITPEGNEISQTYYLYGILLPPDGGQIPVVFGFSSTQIRKYQAVIDRIRSLERFNSEGKKVGPPIYAFRWRIRTLPEKNKQGSWFGIRFDAAGETLIKSLMPKTDPLFDRAKSFHQLLAEGAATAQREQMSMSPEDLGDIDDDIPLD